MKKGYESVVPIGGKHGLMHVGEVGEESHCTH
jgi:hypothetical protein